LSDIHDNGVDDDVDENAQHAAIVEETKTLVSDVYNLGSAVRELDHGSRYKKKIKRRIRISDLICIK